MDSSTLTICLVGIFFIANLTVGLWFGRKSTSIRDYALANKSYGVGPLVMTFLATTVGGGYLFVRVGEIFHLGMGAFYSILSIPLAFLVAGKYIAPKMVRFRNCLSLGDIIGQLYGADSKILAGILIVLLNSVVGGMNIAFLGLIFENFLHLNGNFGIVIGGIIVTLYSCSGGMKAVTATDIFQFVFLVGSLLLIAIFSVQKVGNLEILLTQIPADKFEFFGSEKIYSFLALIFTDVLFFRFLTSPPYMDRLLMAKSSYDLRKMLYISGIALGVIVTLLAIISFSALVMDPKMDSSNIILYMINNLLPGWLKGFAVVGIIAVVFSTADSYMHSAGVALSCNILKPYREKFGLDTNELKWAKIGTAMAGLFTIWFALGGQHLFKPEYWRCIIVPVLSAPLIFGIMGVRPERKAFWISALAAAVTLILCKTVHPGIYPIISSMAIVISMCVSALTYIVANIQINGGLYIVESDGYNDPTAEKWVPNPKKILNLLTYVLTYPFYFAERCRNNLKYGAPFGLFGAVYCVMLVLPYFLWVQLTPEFGDLILYLRLLGVFLCALLMTVYIWPQVMVKYVPAFWFIVLTYCLPFLSTLLLIYTGGSTEYIINAVITIMFLLLLVDWISALYMSIIGALVAVLIYKYGMCYSMVKEINFSFNTMYLLVYHVIVASTIGLLFSRKRENIFSRLRLSNSDLKMKLNLQNIDLKGACSMKERVYKGLTKREIDILARVSNLEKSYSKLLEYGPKDKDFIEEYNEGIRTIKYLEDLIERAKEYLKLNVETVHIDSILSFMNEMTNIYAGDNYSIVTRTDSKEIECDYKMLQSVLCEGITQVAQNNTNDDHILIDISDVKLKYTLPSLRNYEKVINAYRFTISTVGYLSKGSLKDVYVEDFQNQKDILPLDEIGDDVSDEVKEVVDNIMNYRILSAHSGVSETIDSDEGYTKIYVIPKHVREIRPLSLDLEVPKEAVVVWPGALDLENKLKEEIKRKAPRIDLNKIDKAFDIIKKYHSHQMRKSGEPYYLHPLNVALIELEWSQSEEAILGALMHDLLEDTAFNIIDLKTVFGDRIAEIVFGVSKIDIGGKFHSNEEHIKDISKITDFTILSIKISDRIHNMRTIAGHENADKRRAIAQETLDFFVPMALSLGLERASDELKSLAEKEL